MSSTDETLGGWQEDHHRLEAEPEPIPEGWSRRDVETPTHGNALFLAIAYAPSSRSFAEVFDTISQAPDEIKTISVLYVRRDAHRGFVRTYRRTESSSGGQIPDPETYATGLARPPSFGDHVPEGSDRRREYALVLHDRYGLELPELVSADGGGAGA